MFYPLILLFLCCCSNFVWSANTIAIIDSDHDAINIVEHSDYFIDDGKTLSLDDITSDKYAKQFLPTNNDYFRFGLVQGNIWIRADIAIQTPQSTPVLLEIKSPRIQYLDIYLPRTHDARAHTQLGNARSFQNKDIKTPNYLLTMPANMPPVFTVYLKLSSNRPINTEIHLKTLSRLSLDHQISHSFTGILIGILLTLFISNLFFYIKSSHSMYLLYCFLLINIAIVHFALHDQLTQFFPHIIGIQEHIYKTSCLLGLSALVFFSRSYLDTKKHFPVFDIFLLTIGGLHLLVALISIPAPEVINSIALSSIAAFTLVILTTHAIISFIKKVPSSGYYLIARLTLLIGHTAWIMSIYSIFDNTILLGWGFTITTTIEALIHFTGMMVQTRPLLSKNTHDTPYTQTETFELLEDLSNRLRRQINIIGGGLTHLEQAAKSPDTMALLTSTQTANQNIKNIVERIDCISDITEILKKEQDSTLYLNQLIDNASNYFQRLDQDSTLVNFNSTAPDKLEILHNSSIIEHLLATIPQEFKHFTDQELTIDITYHEINREGIKTLEINCYPLPTRVHQSAGDFDFGIGYISLLLQYLEGGFNLSQNEVARSINISIPIQAHIRQSNHDAIQHDQFNIALLGQEDNDLRKALTLLQNSTNKIEQFSTLDSILEHLDEPKERTSPTIILIFDNGGHIPHITQQRLLPLMRPEDQSLLISNNIKMSLDYVRKIGFDDLLSCAELDQKFIQQLSSLMQKSDRLKNAPLSRINVLRKTS